MGAGTNNFVPAGKQKTGHAAHNDEARTFSRKLRAMAARRTHYVVHYRRRFAVIVQAACLPLSPG